MNILHSEFTVSDTIGMLDRKEIIVNTTYQRSAGIWPPSAQSYFIDTILEGYAFPKIFFYQSMDKNARKPIKEIVDGQQRIHAIKSFLSNKLRLNSASKKYAGLIFSDLPEEKQNDFIMYSIQTDIITSASRAELLEIFRRMNSYTAPLNPAEKRHSKYQGEFKWFINELADKYSPVLQELEILTDKQILRMADAELLAELCLILDRGIINKSEAAIEAIYKKNDTRFQKRDEWEKIFDDFFEVFSTSFKSLHSTFMMKSYAFHSLFAAMVFLKYGIPNGKETFESETIGKFYLDLDTALDELVGMSIAHELQDKEGKYGEYVKACLESTTKLAQRRIRTKCIIKALTNEQFE